MLFNLINLNKSKASSLKETGDLNSNVTHTIADIEACMADTCKIVANSYGLFKNKAKEQVMKQTNFYVGSASYIVYCSTFWPGFECCV